MMGIAELNNAVRELSRFNRLSTRNDLIASELSHAVNVGQMSLQAGRSFSSLIDRLADVLVSGQQGALRMRDITVRLDQLTAESGQVSVAALRDAVAATLIIISTASGTEPYKRSISDALDGIDSSVSLSSLSALCVMNPRLSLSARDAVATALFMTAMPTIELSRCVPFIDITIVSGRQSIGHDNKPQGMSIVQLLKGAQPLDSGARIVHTARPAGEPVAASNGVSVHGIESFLIPQTMLSEQTVRDSRATDIADRMRPPVSLIKLTLDLTGAGGAMSYKAGTLELILHDRTRMADLADMLNPRLFGQTELMIEYGWSHPDPAGANAYGTLINSMRVKEKFTITNVSFAFSNAGQVTLTLNIAIKGPAEMRDIKIGDQDGAVSDMRRIKRAIAKLVSENRGFDTMFREIRPDQLISEASNIDAGVKLSKDAIAQLRAVMSSGKGKLGSGQGVGGQLSALRDELRALYGNDGSGGASARAASSIASVISSRLKALGHDSKSDPFLRLGSSDPVASRSRHASLGRVMMAFVGIPLIQARTEMGFDDVQLLFYTFNDAAGLMRNRSIASFMIDLERLSTVINELALVRQSANVSLREFMTMVMNAFIDDMASVNYGMSSVYTSKYNSATGRIEIEQKKANADEKSLRSEVERLMVAASVPAGEFRMPIVDFFIESLPVSDDVTRTVLRIHVIDRQTTSYSTQAALLKSRIDASISNVKAARSGGAPAATSDRELLDEIKRLDLIDGVSTEGDGKIYQYGIKGGIDRLKDVISMSMPTIVYGSSATTLRDVRLASNANAALTTVHMIRHGYGGPLQPSGIAQGRLPLRVHPMQLDITSLGCPTLGFMQQFFFDFGTNTTADNIYACSSVTHELTQGSFTTTAKLLPIDGYGTYESLLSALEALNININA